MLRFVQSFFHRDQAPVPGELMRAAGFSGAEYECAEEHLARDVQQMDVEQPDWSRDVAVQDAKHRLALGMATADDVAIFGSEVVRQAYQELASGDLALEEVRVDADAPAHDYGLMA